ncbi:hypothetical protein M422DRAFT_782893 [Sphaerobolus stellatus SS14]|uniref:Uncharacterized protein n=1 Tax=Sphaerobolus stellatus (strain SS14) TaxID=990650 RepID=A0A0C9UYX1_SPHS4|nr:hypothetical protein M422DRAFT_782893 [Sphaerobolus stellatus SS14]
MSTATSASLNTQKTGAVTSSKPHDRKPAIEEDEHMHGNSENETRSSNGSGGDSDEDSVQKEPTQSDSQGDTRTGGIKLINKRTAGTTDDGENTHDRLNKKQKGVSTSDPSRPKPPLSIPTTLSFPPPFTIRIPFTPYIPPTDEPLTLANTVELVPPPAAGYPQINVGSLEIYSNLEDDSRKAWDNILGRKLIAWLTNAKTPKNFTRIVAALRTTLAGFFPHRDPEDIFIGTPHLKRHGAASITPILIGRLSDEEADLLADTGAIITQAITFFVRPYDISLSPYIMTLRGFPMTPSTTNNEMVRSVVQAKVLSGPISNFIRKYHDNLDPSLSKDQAVSTIATITPPSKNKDRHAQWLKLMTGATYTIGAGVGSAIRPYFCQVCKANDHPTGLCEYPDTPGWIERPADEFLPASELRPLSNARGRGRGQPPTIRGTRGSHGDYRGRGGHGGCANKDRSHNANNDNNHEDFYEN